MKVIRAKSAGFCWGVERAIHIVRQFAKEENRPAYTDGPLIHNKQMMAQLKTEGVREVGDYQSRSAIAVDPETPENAVLVVRAHGISPQRRKYLKSLNLPFRDATCPDVGIIAGKIRTHARKGYTTVIFGNPNHPEVIGLMGYAEQRGHVIESRQDIDALPKLGDKVLFVSQSTMFTETFNELADYLQGRYPDLVVCDTICNATKERQTDLKKLVEAGAEAMVIIGGHHSANTQKLARLARQRNLPTYAIETAAEIDPDRMKAYATVGVTAGASTPEFIIDAVCEKLEEI